MNLSGVEVKNKMKKLNVPIERLVVVYDDADLDYGVVRYKDKGSAGGHNGIKSIIESLGSSDFKRIRFGVGRDGGSLYDYVLSDFTEEELQNLPFEKAERLLKNIVWEVI
mgnify:CR=1 FL=1